MRNHGKNYVNLDAFIEMFLTIKLSYIYFILIKTFIIYYLISYLYICICSIYSMLNIYTYLYF